MTSSSTLGLRIIIAAENASFRFGGEASLPLHYFAQLRARDIEAWLIVHGRTQAELESTLPHEQGRIRYIQDRWFHKAIWQCGRLLPRRISEATFGTLMVLVNQLVQRSMVKDLVRSERVNIVHQPIPVSPKAPSLLYDLGVPVVIGPMNGGMEYPLAFRSAESAFTRIAVEFGRAGANWINRLLPGKLRATVLLVANQRTRHALPSTIQEPSPTSKQRSIQEIPENGVDLRIWTPPAPGSARPAEPRFLFIGRLVDWKRLDIAIRALAATPQARLHVIGDGPMRTAWSALASQLGVADRTSFLGWLSQADCAEHLRCSTALILPSLYECGGAVVLEAMATSTPVIAAAWGGPADYIDPSCGLLVDPSSEEAMIRGFTEAMQTLAADPDLRARLGAAGRAKVEKDYDWNRKIDRMLEIYNQAIGQS